MSDASIEMVHDPVMEAFIRAQGALGRIKEQVDDAYTRINARLEAEMKHLGQLIDEGKA